MKTALTVILLGGLLLATVLVVIRVMAGLGDVTLSGHGIAALILGVVFTLIVGGGLMFLIFYSSRRGHDDSAHRGP